MLVTYMLAGAAPGVTLLNLLHVQATKHASNGIQLILKARGGVPRTAKQ